MVIELTDRSLSREFGPCAADLLIAEKSQHTTIFNAIANDSKCQSLSGADVVARTNGSGNHSIAP